MQQLVFRGMSAMAAAMAVALPGWAQGASATIRFTETGGSVVGTARGEVDTTSLTPYMSGSLTGMTAPNFAIVGSGPYLVYFGLTYDMGSSPWSYSSDSFVADSNSGNFFGVGVLSFNDCYIGVNPDYVSGQNLSSSSTWNGQTFASMGLNPGTYRFQYGQRNESEVRIVVGNAGAVPEPGEWAALGILGAGLAGLVIRQRARGCA